MNATAQDLKVMHELCNQIYIKPTSTWDHSPEKITFFCLSIKFYIYFCFFFPCLSPTVKFSYRFSLVRSYWLKKNNSPRVSHFSLALQISSLERKDLFEITGANKKYFNVKYFTVAILVTAVSNLNFQFLILQSIQTICILVKEFIFTTQHSQYYLLSSLQRIKIDVLCYFSTMFTSIKCCWKRADSSLLENTLCSGADAKITTYFRKYIKLF